jgi:hypothetical protein
VRLEKLKKMEKVRRLRRCPRDPLLSMPDNSPVAIAMCSILCLPFSKYVAVGSWHFGAPPRAPVSRAGQLDLAHGTHGAKRLKSVDEGMVHSEQNVYTKYADPRRTEWITKIQPALRKPKLEVLVEACGKQLCRREIIELRAGRKKLHRRTQQLLESILKRLGFL